MGYTKCSDDIEEAVATLSHSQGARHYAAGIAPLTW